MSEFEQSPEHIVPTREQVVETLKALVDQGYESPDDLPVDDEKVKAANELLARWAEDAERRANSDPSLGADIMYSVSRTTVHVDAGFNDPQYLDEVANDWLQNELSEAEHANLKDVARHIKSLIADINREIEGKA